MNIHRTSFSNHASRISDYFEMCCFNYVVRFYKNKGYTVEVENLQAGKYRYKCSTQGNQINFSHFKVTKVLSETTFNFEIHHNLAVESFHEKLIYTTPDISIIKAGTIIEDLNHYGGAKKLSFVENMNLISFCEVKQFTPFPELLFNFMGTINELSNRILLKKQKTLKPVHIAPSLMISGKPNPHSTLIKKSLEKRYCVNILYDLFSTSNNPFKKHYIGAIKTIQSNEIEVDIATLF